MKYLLITAMLFSVAFTQTYKDTSLTNYNGVEFYNSTQKEADFTYSTDLFISQKFQSILIRKGCVIYVSNITQETTSFTFYNGFFHESIKLAPSQTITLYPKPTADRVYLTFPLDKVKRPTNVGEPKLSNPIDIYVINVHKECYDLNRHLK